MNDGMTHNKDNFSLYFDDIKRGREVHSKSKERFNVNAQISA